MTEIRRKEESNYKIIFLKDDEEILEEVLKP